MPLYVLIFLHSIIFIDLQLVFFFFFIFKCKIFLVQSHVTFNFKSNLKFSNLNTHKYYSTASYVSFVYSIDVINIDMWVCMFHGSMPGHSDS